MNTKPYPCCNNNQPVILPEDMAFAQFIVDGGIFTTFGMLATADQICVIDWGDGTTEQVTGTGSLEEYSHTYADGSPYVITVTGNGILTLVIGGLYTEDELLEIISLPDGLLVLNCNNNELTYLPALPDSLTSLNCGTNNISELPALPSGLNYLACAENEITELPDLPSGLMHLLCGNNLLTSLPAISGLDALLDIDCGYNQLTAIPSFPNNITLLNAISNLLTNLPTIPLALKSVNVAFNIIPSANVNSILINEDSNGATNGTLIIDNQTPSAPPSGLGITAKANLISKGWTAVTD